MSRTINPSNTLQEGTPFLLKPLTGQVAFHQLEFMYGCPGVNDSCGVN